MAVTVSTQQNPIATIMVEDTAAVATAVNNTTGNSGTLFMVEIVNSAGAIVYFKLADATSATGGTTAADLVLRCPASATRSYAFPNGIAFANGFSHWCVAGASESSTSAPGSVTVRYITSAS